MFHPTLSCFVVGGDKYGPSRFPVWQLLPLLARMTVLSWTATRVYSACLTRAHSSQLAGNEGKSSNMILSHRLRNIWTEVISWPVPPRVLVSSYRQTKNNSDNSLLWIAEDPCVAALRIRTGLHPAGVKITSLIGAEQSSVWLTLWRDNGPHPLQAASRSLFFLNLHTFGPAETFCFTLMRWKLKHCRQETSGTPNSQQRHANKDVLSLIPGICKSAHRPWRPKVRGRPNIPATAGLMMMSFQNIINVPHHAASTYAGMYRFCERWSPAPG